MYKLILEQKKGKKKEKLEIRVPQTWYEVSVAQYLAIEKLEDRQDVLAFISILANVDKNVIGEITNEKLMTKLKNLVANILGEQVNWKKLIQDVPKTVLVKGKELKVKNYGKFTLAQRIMFEQLLVEKQPKEDEDLIELIPETCAIAFYPEYYNEPLNREKLPEFLKLINEQPVVRMISPAYFFLIILLSLTARGVISSNLQFLRTLIVNLLKKRAKQKGGKNLQISA